jgi:hypothetical protein
VFLDSGLKRRRALFEGKAGEESLLLLLLLLPLSQYSLPLKIPVEVHVRLRINIGDMKSIPGPMTSYKFQRSSRFIAVGVVQHSF